MPELVPNTKRSFKKLKNIIFLLLFLSTAVLGKLYYDTRQELMAVRENPQLYVEREVQDVVNEVSKLINLPEGETPVLANVDNAEELKENQPFFNDAQDGDKVLIYSQSSDPAYRKAYLYRPSEKRLLNVAPLVIGGSQVQAQEDEFSIILRNGTTKAGLTDDMEELLARVYPNAEVRAKGNAKDSNYEKSILVRINASDELTEKVSKFFNLEVVNLPEGEAVAEGVDLLLILGSASESDASTSSDES